MWNAGLKNLLINGKWDYGNPISQEVEGHAYKMIRQNYGDALDWSGFSGGMDLFSHWVYKQDLLDLLSRKGFSKIDVAFDKADHPNGPSFCLYCEK